MRGFGSTADELTFGRKFWLLNWTLVLVIAATTAIGVAMLYSAANGSWSPWATRQILRFGVCLVIMLVIAFTDIRIWMRAAYPIYGAAVALLLAVEIAGATGMGAQRWIDLGVMRLQPSELMKIALVMGLARYFHGETIEDTGRITRLIVPVAMVLAPAALVLKQPDLGTAVMLILGGGAMFFAAGVRLWKFGVVLAAALGALPVGWSFLHDYQRQRILTFLDPSSDPLGSGYHILQSKIALGSGAMFGKGFLAGTQAHLNFLPEKQTDFIFTMLAEEFGLAGGVVLLALYGIIIIYAFAIALRARNHFARLLSIGVGSTLFLYVFINIAMVMGLIPVVGVPLPLISYGGTAMLTIMGGIGLMLSASIHRDVRIGRFGDSGEI